MIDPLMLMPMLMNMNGGGGNNMENILKMVSGINGNNTPPQPAQNTAVGSSNMDMTSLLSALGGSGGDKSNPMLNILPTMMSMMNNNQQNTNIPPQNNGNIPPQQYTNSPQGYNANQNYQPPYSDNVTSQQYSAPQNMANIKPLAKKSRNANEYHGYYQDLDMPNQPSNDINSGYNNMANTMANNAAPYNQATARDTGAATPQNSPNSPNIAPNAHQTQGSGFAPIGDLSKNDINYALFNLMKNKG